jgi:hypothetical protein
MLQNLLKLDLWRVTSNAISVQSPAYFFHGLCASNLEEAQLQDDLKENSIVVHFHSVHQI